jgi:uncharacterized integral membrane protein (TIGR00698 family)
VSTRALPGLVIAALIATLAVALAPFAPILGAPVIAILLGVAARTCVEIPPPLQPGIAFASRIVLQFAIVVSGFGISLADVASSGIGTLPITLVTVAIALGLAPVAGRLLGVRGNVRELVGIGTAICGASAIAAASSVIEPSEAETALAIATIFLYNIVAVLAFPALGHLMGLTQQQFGTWAGTAINDTSSVVAAGFSYGHEAGTQATIVKLTRAMLILPIVGALAIVRTRAKGATDKPIPWPSIVPWFIVLFLVAALVETLGFVPAAWHAAIASLSTFALCVALAAIGLQTALRNLVRTGPQPLALGFILWLAVAFSSLGMQRLTGR